MTPSNEPRFNPDRARSYWRHAPSGKGKHDTTVMAALPDAELAAEWDAAFVARFRAYPEEDAFIQSFADSVSGQQLLSIGSGLGFHELYYASAGATVTCADIVPSNLRVIERVAAIKGLPGVRTVAIEGDVFDPDFSFDTLFVYGALMHMPRDHQRRLFQNANRRINPGGRIVLMLYTWTFVSEMCGWTSPDQFDPVAFGRKSDPSVGEEACPWADWHDDAALREVTGPEWSITRKQTWNRDYFVWYELTRDAPQSAGFFDEDAPRGTVLQTIGGAELVPGDAVADAGLPGAFTTSSNQMHYAAMTQPITVTQRERVNAVSVAIELHSGCVSIGILDVAAQRFVSSVVINAIGAAHATLIVEPLPPTCQVIVSNHHDSTPGVSRFHVHAVDFRTITLAQPPQARRRS